MRFAVSWKLIYWFYVDFHGLKLQLQGGKEERTKSFFQEDYFNLQEV